MDDQARPPFNLEVLDSLDLFAYSWDPRDQSDQISYHSPYFLRLTGYPLESFQDPSFWIHIVFPEDRALIAEVDGKLRRGERYSVEYRILTRDGRTVWISDNAVPLQQEGETVRVEGVMQDITLRKQAEEALRESEDRYRLLVDSQEEGVIIGDAKENILFANPSAARILGCPLSDLIGRNMREFIDPSQQPFYEQQILARQKGEKGFYELQITQPDGTRRLIQITSTPRLDKQDCFIGSFGVFSDITSSKQAEEERNRLASFLQLTPDPIVEVGLHGQLRYANEMAHLLFPDLEARGFQHPFFSGLPSIFALMKTKNLETMVREVHVGEMLYQQAVHSVENGRALRIFSVDVTERKQAEDGLRTSEQRYRLLVERNLAGFFRTLPNGRILDCNDGFAKILGFSSKEELLTEQANRFYVNPGERDLFVSRLFEEGSISNLELQIQQRDGTVAWILENASLIVGEPGAPVVIQGTVIDITERKKNLELLEQSLQKLRLTLEQTVHALASLAEMKDPYTAGHQLHVAQLSSAIARELEFDEERIEGVRVAANLHDLGKLYIPAEILSKPGRLSDIEFTMIRTHAQFSHDILRSIDFPWPVARIALEHHERMDGSGYPQGLKDGEILLEARILAVADVVEAMTFHRPYRSSLGIDKALHEIESNRGTLYDAQVVDACCCLFREKEFAFE